MNSSWIKSLLVIMPLSSERNLLMVEALRVRSRFITNSVWVLPLSVLLAASLVGCGSGKRMANQAPIQPVPSSKADNWQFLLAPASSDVPLASDIEAVLSLTPDKFVGTARIIGAGYPNSDPCYNIVDPIPLSGTIDAQRNISVTSGAVRGRVLSFPGILATDRSWVSLGTAGHSGQINAPLRRAV